MTNQMQDFSKYPAMDYFMNEDLCDVVFEVKGQRMPALKALLSIKNRVFRKMFSENKKFNNQKISVIKIFDIFEDISFESFKTFIQYLHCDQLFLKEDGLDDGLNRSEEYFLIKDLLFLSKKYEAIHLFDIIHKHLMEMTISFSNLSNITRLAYRYQIEDVFSKVMPFVDHNWDEFMEDHNWGQTLELFNIWTEGRLFKVLAQKYLKLNNCNEKNIGFNNKDPENYNQSKVWVNRNDSQKSCAVVPNPHSTKPTYNSTLIFNGKGFDKIKFKPFRARNIKEKDPRFNAKKTSPDN